MQERKDFNKSKSGKKPFKKDKVRYAIASGPTIQAILNQLFRFEKEEQALARINALKETFIISKDQEEGGKSLKLWIKNYSISEDEAKEGYKGNFAVIRYKKTGDGKFTVFAEKLETPMKHHPQKVRVKQKHPDWGNPILRNIKRKFKYKSLNEAQVDLDNLHQEYPETSIPAINKLYIMIYEKTDNREKQAPVRKFVLELKPDEKGEFFIDWKLNDKADRADKVKEVMHKKPVASPPSSGSSDVSAPQPKGYFTAMVELKKKRKFTRPTLPKPEDKGGSS